MTSFPAAFLLCQIQHLVTVPTLAHLSDRELLRRFTKERDDASFSMIVSRHGPMVWQVCQRVLHNSHEAEDAFQATFLVLARKAGSSHWRESVGNWLYGVAFHISRQAKASALRRHVHESRVGAKPQVDPAAEITLREAQTALDEELVQLPERFRVPLVLCYLEGATRDEAARQLGWSLGTLKRRLESARALLHVRLTRRGLTLSGTLLAAALVSSAARAEVPAALLVSTLKTALSCASSGKTVTGVVTPEVVKLVEGAVNALWVSKLKVAATLVITVGLLMAGAGLGAHRALTVEPEETKPETHAQMLGDKGVASKPAKKEEARVDCFGDPLPPGALVRMGTMRYAHGDSTGYPVLAPDQKTFATVSRYTPSGRGPVVCLWNADTGKELSQLYDPDFEHFHAFFLKSENLVGTIGVSRKPAHGDTYTYAMHFWDPATGKKAAVCIEESGYHFEPWALSPDENLIACASREPPVLVRDRKTGKVVAEWEGEGTRVNHLVFSPDGKTVAVCCGNAIHLWNWKGNGEPRRLGDFKGGVERLWFSPDGRWIAAAVGKEGLRVWEANELKEVRRFKGEHDIRFFPDGKRIVSAATGVIWDVSSGKQLGKLEDCAHCLALDFALDGRTATGYALGRIRRWNTETGKDQSPPSLNISRIMVHQVGFLPDGKAVVAASPDGSVRVWDATTGKELRTLIKGTAWDHHPPLMRVAADGTVIVARGNRLSFFKGETMADQVTLKGFPVDGLASLNLSPDGKYLILAGGTNAKNVVQLWDLSARKVVADFAPPETTNLATLGVSSTGAVAAHVGDSLCLLNGNTGSIERMLDKRPETPAKRDDRGGYSYFPGIQALTFSPDGEILVSGGPPSGGLKLLDVFSAKPRHILLPPAKDNRHYELTNAVFSPDGRMIAAESETGVVDVWETSSGQRRRRFLGHRSYQTTIAFSRDGIRLATGNRDGTILIWDVFGISTDRPPDWAPRTQEELKALWARLQADDGEQAFLAMGRLMRYPDLSKPFLKRQLLVRKSAEVARLKAWITDLDDDQFDKRETAANQLAQRLPMAEPLLRRSLAAKPTLEARRRLQDLLANAGTKPLPAETIRDLRALEVMEHLEPAAIGELARELMTGNYDPLVAAAAQAAHRRLAGRVP